MKRLTTTLQAGYFKKISSPFSSMKYNMIHNSSHTLFTTQVNSLVATKTIPAHLVDYSLYFIIDLTPSSLSIQQQENLLCLLPQLIQQGITCIQLRGKEITEETFLAIGKKLLPIVRQHKIPFIINDSIKIAKLLNADGVHVGQYDTPISEVRKAMGPDKILGLSIENKSQAQQYQSSSLIDYFGVGPVFSTKSKADAALPIGISDLHLIASILSNKPTVAIGGINLTNVEKIFSSTTINGVAIISAIGKAENPCQAAKAFSKIIQSYHPHQTHLLR